MACHTLPPAIAASLDPYLPRPINQEHGRPFVTLTFTTSLDSALAITPGRPTLLSGPESLGVTHFLRSRHDAILVGVGTLLADNPSLNCRLAPPDLPPPPPARDSDGRPNAPPAPSRPPSPPRLRPVIVDPDCRWDMDPANSKVLRLAADGLGLAPYVVSRRRPDCDAAARLEALGGKVIEIKAAAIHSAGRTAYRFRWADIFTALAAEGISSVMVEGGGAVIGALLGPEGEGWVDSVVLTLAPTWLGEGSLFVRPVRRHDEGGVAVPAAALSHVTWHQIGRDVMLCGRLCLP